MMLEVARGYYCVHWPSFIILICVHDSDTTLTPWQFVSHVVIAFNQSWTNHWCGSEWKTLRLQAIMTSHDSYCCIPFIWIPGRNGVLWTRGSDLNVASRQREGYLHVVTRTSSTDFVPKKKQYCITYILDISIKPAPISLTNIYAQLQHFSIIFTKVSTFGYVIYSSADAHSAEE